MKPDRYIWEEFSISIVVVGNSKAQRDDLGPKMSRWVHAFDTFFEQRSLDVVDPLFRGTELEDMLSQRSGTTSVLARFEIPSENGINFDPTERFRKVEIRRKLDVSEPTI